ncbi:MAG: hypothetical protein AAF125_03645 [Chloroflexota bacterium]
MFDTVRNIINGVEVPNLFVSDRVIEKMVQGGLQYLEDETGEAMVGVILKDKNAGGQSVYIVDTIAPGDDAHRESHTFHQGGEWQDGKLQWLRENWEIARKKRARSTGSSIANWDAPLYLVGEWHKQPGWMIHPSMGDMHTALDIITPLTHSFGFLVAPILTINHPATVKDDKENSNFITVQQPNGEMTRIDFWFIARGMTSFAPIIPQVLPERSFPRLMDYPWHITSPRRAAQEFSLLENDGMMVELLLWDTDEELPLEVCFFTARPGAKEFLLIATQANYPFAGPDVYRMPFASIQPGEDIYDLMRRQWTYAELVEEAEGFEWSAEKTLLEYVYMIEDALGWNPNPLTSGEPVAAAIGDAPAEDTPDTPTEDVTE